jgi:hypothetical protein
VFLTFAVAAAAVSVRSLREREAVIDVSDHALIEAGT